MYQWRKINFGFLKCYKNYFLATIVIVNRGPKHQFLFARSNAFRNKQVFPYPLRISTLSHDDRNLKLKRISYTLRRQFSLCVYCPKAIYSFSLRWSVWALRKKRVFFHCNCNWENSCLQSLLNTTSNKNIWNFFSMGWAIDH